MMHDSARGRSLNSEHLLQDLRNALDQQPTEESEFARLDFSRASRTGTPEIILAEHKPVSQVIELVSRMIDRNGRALVSRASDATIEQVKSTFAEDQIEHPELSSMLRIIRSGGPEVPTTGRVAVFTAGTSDLPRAHEVRLVAEEMGSVVRVWPDIGVAGIHRIIQPFRAAIDWDVSAIVVVAGMDGALPSVIAGLSPVPVIGLPVSTGYGYGGNGEGALLAMLQTCAPGLTVVNIDNSVGAGVAAARIAWQSKQETK